MRLSVSSAKVPPENNGNIGSQSTGEDEEGDDSGLGVIVMQMVLGTV